MLEAYNSNGICQLELVLGQNRFSIPTPCYNIANTLLDSSFFVGFGFSETNNGSTQYPHNYLSTLYVRYIRIHKILSPNRMVGRKKKHISEHQKSTREIINSKVRFIIMMSCLPCMTSDPYASPEATVSPESSLFCAERAELRITVSIKCDLVF